MRYVLNTAVITKPGSYHYHYVSVSEAQAWLSAGDFYATLGYQETVDAFRNVLGITLEVNRSTVRMKEGDEALVFRLKKRVPAAMLKGVLSAQFITENYELGLLRRVL